MNTPYVKQNRNSGRVDRQSPRKSKSHPLVYLITKCPEQGPLRPIYWAYALNKTMADRRRRRGEDENMNCCLDMRLSCSDVWNAQKSAVWQRMLQSANTPKTTHFWWTHVDDCRHAASAASSGFTARPRSILLFLKKAFVPLLWRIKYEMTWIVGQR